MKRVVLLSIVIASLAPIPAPSDNASWRTEVNAKRSEICQTDRSYLACLDRLSKLVAQDYREHSDDYENVLYSLLWDGSETLDVSLLAALMTIVPQGTHNLEEYDAWRSALPFENTRTYMQAIIILSQDNAEAVEMLARGAGHAYIHRLIDDKKLEAFEAADSALSIYRDRPRFRFYFASFDTGADSALDHLEEFAERQLSRKSADANDLAFKANIARLRCRFSGSCKETH